MPRNGKIKAMSKQEVPFINLAIANAKTKTEQKGKEVGSISLQLQVKLAFNYENILHTLKD